MIFHFTFEHAEDGWIVYECPALPGCVSRGKEEREARENIREAMTTWLWAENQKALSNDSSRKGHQPNDVELP